MHVLAKLGRLLILVSLLFIPSIGAVSGSTAVNITGGSSSAPVDITGHIIAGDTITLDGGYFVVTIPVAGAPGTATPAAVHANNDTFYDITDYGSGHFVSSAAPVVVYRKSITGTGSLIVTNATDAVDNPSTDPATGPHPFTGGVLLFTAEEVFSSGTSAPTLIIAPNTTVAFDQGSGSDPSGAWGSDAATPGNVVAGSRNIQNDGYFYQYINSQKYSNVYYADIVNSVAGAGVITWENGGGATNGGHYTGHVLASAGGHVQAQADYRMDNSVNLNDFSFETIGPDYLTGTAPSFESTYGGNLYNFGVDFQIQSNAGSGIKVLNGLTPTPTGNTKKDFAPVVQTLDCTYCIPSQGSFGLNIYIQATLQEGSGQTIVNNSNGTNNVAIQGNYSSIFLQTGNFESPPNSASDVLALQTLAYDYSGTYPVDNCLNAGPINGGQISTEVNNGNLVLVDPTPAGGASVPANHIVITCPELAQGLVVVNAHTILQLGDGTVGNQAQLSVNISGTPTVLPTSSSGGTGMIITKLNSAWPQFNPQFSQVIDNGQIIVDNMVGSLNLTLPWSDSHVVPLIQANQLDTINGSGSVEQKGSLPLTLAGVSTYTGGTTVDAGTTLIVASSTALGNALTSIAGTGKVTNNGNIEISGNNRIINVPGDYLQ